MDSEQSAVTSEFDEEMEIEEQRIEYKRLEWFSMKKRITGLINKVNISNIQQVGSEILNENLSEGRGLFCQAIMKSQMEFPQFSNVYAALVAIINSDFSDVGLLLVKRVVLQFKGVYESSNNKKKMLSILKFLAHLVNQTVVFELVAVDVFMLVFGNPTSDNVEVAVKFCIQCGSSLQGFSPHKFRYVLEEFHRILHEGVVASHVQILILKLFAIKRSKFKDYPGIIDELDLVEVEDQVTHHVSLIHYIDPETSVDDFKVDSSQFNEHEKCSQGTISFEECLEDNEVSSKGPLTADGHKDWD